MKEHGKTGKKLLIGLVSIIAVIVAVFVVYVAVYFGTTIPSDKIKAYCIEHSARMATDFELCVNTDKSDGYEYWVAVDGGTPYQEVFVFKINQKKIFTFFNHYLDRYKYISSTPATYGNEEKSKKVGVLRFKPKDKYGDDEFFNGDTLLFFGSCKDSDIVSYEYKLTTRDGTNVYKGDVYRVSNKTWNVQFTDLEEFEGPRKKIVSDIKFFDSKGNLVYSYDNA